MEGYLKLNKDLAKKVGLTAAALHADLLGKQQYFAKLGRLDADGYFFNSHENIEQDTCIGKRQQYNLIQLLESEGLLLVKGVKGGANRFRVLEVQTKVTPAETAIPPQQKLPNPPQQLLPGPPQQKLPANNNNINKNKELPTGVLTNTNNQDVPAVKTEEESKWSASRQDQYKLDCLLSDLDWLLPCLQEAKNPFLLGKLDTTMDAATLYNLLVKCTDNKKEILYTGGSIQIHWLQEMYQQFLKTRKQNG